MVVHIAGKSLGKGAMQLDIETGPIATHGVVVRSEPSRRVLAVVMSHAFEKSPESKAWVSRVTGGEPILARATAPLPTSYLSFGLPDRPADDTGISVRVMGTWPEGRLEERLVAEMTVGHQFDFTSAIGGTGEFEICCGSA